MSNLPISLPNPIDELHLEQLRMASGDGPVLIVAHDNPDPDSLAAGKALSVLFESKWGILSRLVYGGLVARAENKAMLRLLTPEWEEVESIDDLAQYSAVALIDTQPSAGNNSLPPDITPAIVIDHHHPVRETLRYVPYVDVRPEVGATTSLLYQYLQAAGITPDTQLATAMFYGVHADTQGLSRSGSQADQIAYFQLVSLIDRQVLIQVEQAGLPRDYFRAFTRGLQAARLYGQIVVSYLGSIHRPDFTAEMADLLIRLENARAVLCMGHHRDRMYLSLRTDRSEPDAGLLVQQIILPSGKAGGHNTVAGGQVELSEPSQADIVAAELEKRFLSVVNATMPGENLLS